MKDIFEAVGVLLKLISPQNEDLVAIRKDRKQLRLKRKELRIANRMYKSIRKEFKEDGFSAEETEILNDLKRRIRLRKMELI